MTDERDGYADIGDARLYYQTAGEDDRETLVLGHAGFVDSGMWDSQVDALAERYRVVRFDQRGFGRSDVATGPVSRRDDLYRFLTTIGVERAHFLGCSQSGEMIVDFALEHPEMVLSLIPVSAVPSGFEMQGAPPRYLMEMIEAAQQGKVDRASDLQIRIWVDGSYREPGQVDPAVREHAARMNRKPVENATFAVADMEPLNALDPPATARLAEIRAPTLVIVGALDDPEILRAADAMATAIIGARKVVIADTAHVPNMEKPADFNRAVLSFLDGLPR